MSGNQLALIELLLVFGAVLGFGFWQLRILKRIRDREPDQREDSRDSSEP